jgi:hypothetical protein
VKRDELYRVLFKRSIAERTLAWTSSASASQFVPGNVN